MVIYGISDLHLSIDKDKPMDIFNGWENYFERIKSNWCRIVKQEDIVVLPGDLSWALKLEETKSDFMFLESLPGKKIILKGNHDLWWSTVKKINEFFEKENITSVELVFNSCYEVGEYAICGTRGWTKEKESDNKIIAREAQRLRTSLSIAKENNKKPLVFLHYPPVTSDSVATEIIDVLKEFNVNQVYHGHIHGKFNNYVKEYDTISFKLLSCDCIDFTPFEIKTIFF